MTSQPDMLVPFDGSVAAEQLLRSACRVALAERAWLSVMCVVALPPGVEPDQASPSLDHSVLRALTRAQQVCREEGTVATFDLCHARNLGDAVVSEAVRSGATLICLSLNGHKAGATALMSDAVQRVLAAAPCSVWLVDDLAGPAAPAGAPQSG